MKLMGISILIQSHLGQAVGHYDMIKEGDKVMLGLSGGKDSLTMLHCLLQLQRRSPIKFELACVTVDPQTTGFDPSYMYSNCLIVVLFVITVKHWVWSTSMSLVLSLRWLRRSFRMVRFAVGVLEWSEESCIVPCVVKDITCLWVCYKGLRDRFWPNIWMIWLSHSLCLCSIMVSCVLWKLAISTRNKIFEWFVHLCISERNNWESLQRQWIYQSLMRIVLLVLKGDEWRDEWGIDRRNDIEWKHCWQLKRIYSQMCSIVFSQQLFL